jgi:excisionase family DNA binding protein
MIKKSKYISVKQVADYLEISRQVVNKWINEDILKVDRLPSGRVKILRADFLKYLKSHDLHIENKYFGIESPKIVVIDDDEKIRNYIKRFFQRINFNGDVEYAIDGISGLIQIGSVKPNLVLLDIDMPGMNGIEVCKKVLTNNTLPGIKVVIISGYISKYEEELDELNIDERIEKPFKFSDLEKKLLPILNEIYE